MTITIHAAVLFLLGLGLGWVAERALRRATRGTKRGRAIPRGTDGEKKERKPRKAKPEPPAPGPALGMD